MIRRIRSAAVDHDAYGDPVDAAAEDIADLPGAWTAPRTSNEVADRGRQGVVVGLDLYTRDTAADIVRTDLIEDNDGRRYRIVGEPAIWRHPSGWQAGLTAALERAAG